MGLLRAVETVGLLRAIETTGRIINGPYTGHMIDWPNMGQTDRIMAVNGLELESSVHGLTIMRRR